MKQQYTEDQLIHFIREGKIFIYPTDTVYGLGCNALLPEAVKKIKEMKGRDKEKPLSIIAPSKAWIIDTLETTQEYLDTYLPGPYTLILKKKKASTLQHVSSSETLGVRIPNHPFTKIIEKANVPFITTSVNLSGENPAVSLKEINPEIKEKVDIIMEGGELTGKPSTIILPTDEKITR